MLKFTSLSLVIVSAAADTCDSTSFPVDLTGYQYLGLKAGPTSATSELLCQQACCDAGADCGIYQFSEHPSKAPNCWIGKSEQFESDATKVYMSRGRNMVPPQDVCDSTTFPVDLKGKQYLGLQQTSNATSEALCQQACCDAGTTCHIYQFDTSEKKCWLGGDTGKFSGDPSHKYASRGRDVTPPAPPPTPPPGPKGPYSLDDSVGLGLRWEGVGAISGGGATTKLLMDYPEPARSEVLDYLFKPDYGLQLQMLKVELGGDTDATEGAEPSHMHYEGDENYQRGYEWWLMKEAKARNPDIKLYGLPWGWSGWLDPTATADTPAKNAFADPIVTANYTMAWLLGAKREHNLTIDYIGQWNERNAPDAYNKALRDAVASSPVLAGKTTCLNRLSHYPGTKDEMDSQGCTQYEWNSTDGNRWVDEEGSIFDGRSARCLARCVNRNYVSSCKTATFQWHLVSSFYDYLPWSRCGVAVANQPWSGAYEITSPTWSLAHTSQFSPVGWRYAAHGNGVTLLEKGGSMVTRVSPDLEDFSIVIEKMNSANSKCARGSNPDSHPEDEDVVLVLKGNFLKAITEKKRTLQVWYSNLKSGNDEGTNPPDSQLFQRSLPLSVGADGTVRLKVRVEELYTITTLQTGGKGQAQSPEATAFPLPFIQNFDDEALSAPPKIWYDQMGAWEIQETPYSDGRGQVMRQVVPVWPACWGYSCTGPTTYFGANVGGDLSQEGELRVSLELRLEGHAGFTLSARGSDNKDWVALTMNTSDGFAVDQWHSLELRLSKAWGAGAIDGKQVFNVSKGTAMDTGLSFKAQLDRYIFASIDNFEITKPTGDNFFV